MRRIIETNALIQTNQDRRGVFTKMADITKCYGQDCPIKETCYRFTAPVNEYLQGWANFDSIYWESDDAECSHYYPTKPISTISTTKENRK